jgi:hypothetical protein
MASTFRAIVALAVDEVDGAAGFPVSPSIGLNGGVARATDQA